MQDEAKAALLAKTNGTAVTSHLPKGKFTGAPMVQNDPRLVGSVTVDHELKAVAIIFDFAKSTETAIVSGTEPTVSQEML